MTKSIFEKICDRELPGQIIWEDEQFCAFLSIGPLKPGHTLVVPKKNLGDYIFELSDTDYQALLLAAKKVATLLKKSLNVARVLVLVEGFEVPHVHVNLIPAQVNDGLNKGPIAQANPEELARIAEKIIKSK